VRLSHSQGAALIQRVLITLVVTTNKLQNSLMYMSKANLHMAVTY